MGRLCLAAWALATTGIAAPAWADSATAFCSLSRHDHTIPVESGNCQFSQRQGNVTVRFGWWAFRFNANQQGQSYQRDNHANGIRLTREGEFTLDVLWQQP